MGRGVAHTDWASDEGDVEGMLGLLTAWFAVLFAGLHCDASAAAATGMASPAAASAASYAVASAAHVYVRKLGAARRLYRVQRARVRSWEAGSAGSVHSVRRKPCLDRPL